MEEEMNTKGYKAILFAPDGEWVTDFRAETKDEVIEKLSNRGSYWFFYPFEAVILDKGGLTTAQQRLVDSAMPIESLKGKSIKAASRLISEINWEGYF